MEATFHNERHSAILPVTQLAELVHVLDGYRNIVCAYLFGSAALGTMSPLSDVDIGILLSKEPEASDILPALEADLQRAIAERKIDLVLLNEAPCHLGYRVIRDGRLLINRDPAEREAFEVRTITRHLDAKPIREILFQGVRREIQRTA